MRLGSHPGETPECSCHPYSLLRDCLEVLDGSGWIRVQPADEGSVKASLTGGKVAHLAAEVTFGCHMVSSLCLGLALVLQASGGLADLPPSPEGFLCPA